MNFDSGRILQHLVQNQCKRTFVLNLTLQTSFVGWQSHYGLQMRWMCLNAAFYHKNPCFFTGIYPWIHITAELKQRYITLTLTPTPQPNFGQLRHFGQQEKFGQSQFFMLVHRMTLLSFQLFSKNLGNLQEFFGQMVYRPPWQKIARTSMLIKINNIKRFGWCGCYPPRQVIQVYVLSEMLLFLLLLFFMICFLTANIWILK